MSEGVDAGRPRAVGKVGPIGPGSGERARSRDVRPLERLWPYVAAHRRDAALSVISLLFSTGATLSLSAAVRLMVDKGFASASKARLDDTFMVLIACACVLAAATALRFYFISKLGERVVADLRTALYRHVLALDQAFFLEIQSGEVLSRMTTDMTIVETVVGSTVSIALRNILTFLGATIMLAFVSPKLTVCVVLPAPLVLAPLVMYGRRVRGFSVKAQSRFADAIAFASETLDAVDTVQAFVRQRSASRQFGEAVDTAFSASLQRIRARAVMTGGVIILVFGGVAAVLWLGAIEVINRQLSIGALVQFALLSVLGAGSVGALSEVWGEIQKAAGAMERISQLLDARPTISTPDPATPLPSPTRGEVVFRRVSFSYPGRPDLPVLRDFNLHVRPGERVALVGPSGAGKSTVFRLLLRFFDPDAGEVRIDGVRLCDADPDDVRARIALVAQDSPLFSGTAVGNLRFGREDAQEGQIMAAVHSAQADGFLNSLPQGVNTPLGERAKNLSGGERQRLVIARALVRDAPILLLDEATSALDAANERLIQLAIEEAAGGRTSIVIAHRLATVLNADRIVVMDAGQVVEQGSHANLMAQRGLYSDLARLQFGAEIE